MGNGEAKELICMTHARELRWGMMVGWRIQGEGEQSREKNGTTALAGEAQWTERRPSN